MKLIKSVKGLSILAIAIVSLSIISDVALKYHWFSGKLSAEISLEENSLPKDLALSPIHPDEPADYTYNERFSTENALDNVFQITDAFSSFRKLTVEAKRVLAQETLDEIGNTGWERQNLAFPNWVGSIEGTIKKQDYLIKKLELELAQKQHQDREIDRTVLDSKVTGYELAKQDFLEFWESFTVSD